MEKFLNDLNELTQSKMFNEQQMNDWKENQMIYMQENDYKRSQLVGCVPCKTPCNAKETHPGQPHFLFKQYPGKEEPD